MMRTALLLALLLVGACTSAPTAPEPAAEDCGYLGSAGRCL